MTLTKSDVADDLVQNFKDLNHKDALDIIDAIFEEIRHILSLGEVVKISGFGNFEVRNKKKRPGRNPKTGESIDVSARRVVSFKTGQKLKAVFDAGLHKDDNFDGEKLLEE